MESFQSIIIVALLLIMLLLIFLIATVVFFIFKQSKEKNEKENSSEPVKHKPEKAIDSQIGLSYCKHHEKEHAAGICGICEEAFCDKCLKDWERLYFCPEHFNLYAAHNWGPITNFKTTPENPELGHFIYDFKRKKWAEEGIPSFIVTHYKIDVENDFIESYILLHVRDEDVQSLKSEIEQK